MNTFKRITKEYKEFKENMLNKSKAEIYNAFYKIQFYENVYDFISNSEEEINELIQKNTLAKLYDIYLDMENVDIGGHEKVKEFLEVAISEEY